jgi:hypothetical protein
MYNNSTQLNSIDRGWIIKVDLNEQNERRGRRRRRKGILSIHKEGLNEGSGDS